MCAHRQAAQTSLPPPPPPPPAPLLQPPLPADGQASKAEGPASTPKRKREYNHPAVTDEVVAMRIQEHGLKEGPGTSAVWFYYDKYNVGPESDLRAIGLCRMCRKNEDLAKSEVKMGRDLSTGNLKSHLQLHHRAEFQEFLAKAALKAAAKEEGKPAGAKAMDKSTGQPLQEGGEVAGGAVDVPEVRKKKRSRADGAVSRMFMIKTEDVTQVLEDLKQMRDLVRDFQDSSSTSDTSVAHAQAAEYFREWVRGMRAQSLVDARELAVDPPPRAHKPCPPRLAAAAIVPALLVHCRRCSPARTFATTETLNPIRRC